MATPGIQEHCRDYGDRPGCLGTIDERYTMRFDDIGEPPIKWCAHCGPEAHAINALIQSKFDSGDADFVTDFAELIAIAVDEQRWSK